MKPVTCDVWSVMRSEAEQVSREGHEGGEGNRRTAVMGSGIVYPAKSELIRVNPTKNVLTIMKTGVRRSEARMGQRVSALTGSPVYDTSIDMQPNGHLGVVILGAGASSRMGRPKLLLPWGGTTVIGRLVAQWRELGAGQIAVVRRAEDAALVAELDRLDLPKSVSENPETGNLQAGSLRSGSGGSSLPPVDQIINPQPERGMFSSIVCAAGWDGWRGEISNWAIVLGDQPHIQTGTLRLFLAWSAQNREAICQPVSGGHRAHPVILPRPALASLKSTPAGTLKDFLNLATCPNVQCVINDPGLTLDLDTPEDYKRLLAQI